MSDAIKIDLNKPAPTDVCPRVWNKQRALVAWSCINCGGSPQAVVVSATCGVRLDMEQAGINAGDVWSHHKPETPDNGIWLWEGRITDGEDPEYIGEWKDAPELDVLAAARGEDPYQCDECDGAGWISAEALSVRKAKEKSR